ncbi:clathrin coat assembly protein AP180 isoform X12 [Dunckerocampus dactyliophorus]|uniref:clathrin coat assembly protein AP180 isoform X12 n=1 Tax=Dunckerocampus dactyliophorus TaxID=161453 RepID=UPI0024054AA8|nr:clathrin coat assembly protein AP180 isoform X12 [Dunckerocampus dactyliophorus]
MSGQTLTDRIAAAQYSLTGSEVSRAVCKSTTHEQTAPKKKHLEYLIQASQDSSVNVPQMADTLIERAGNASWVVVFKALITTHHLMVHGNEKFLQFLSSRNTLFNLANFLDKTGSHGYDMSTFIRRYGRYLNEKSFTYRQMSFDFVRVKKGAEGAMRTMTVEKLLKGMPILQGQIDALLDFDVHPPELNNGVINACFLLLFKDLIKLYACYNDGIINLLEKFFQMKRSQCKDGLEIYKRFLTRMTRVSDFFKIAEQVGIDKNDIPDLTQAPESLLESLETHLNTLEGRKPSPAKDTAANNSSAAAAPSTAPPKPAPPGPPARPGPPAKPPPPSVTHTAIAPTTTTSSALDDGFLLDLDPMSSSAQGAAAPSTTTGWGDLLADATPAASASASEAPQAKKEAAGAAAASAAAPAVSAPAVATAPAATMPAPTSLPVAAPVTTSVRDMDLFGDAFAPSPGDGPAAVAAGPATDAFGESDVLESMPEQSPTTESKAATTPSVDLFGADPAPTPTPAASVAAPAPAPEASSPPKAESAPVIDLLDSFSGAVEETQSSAPGAPGGDLLGDLMSPTLAPTAAPTLAPVQNDLLESGFEVLGTLPSPTPPVPAAVPAVPMVSAAAATPEPASATPAPSGGFDASMFDGLGDLLMPAVTPQSTGGSTTGSAAGSMGTPVTMENITVAPPATPPPTKTIGGDLDSSLANLVGDLGVKRKDPQSEKKLTGGANWTPQVAPTSWTTPGAPMAGVAPGAPGAAPPSGAMVPPMSAQPGFGMPATGAAMMQPMMAQPMMGQPMMRPPFAGVVGAAPGVAAAPGAPISPGPESQSPKKPKDPLADLDLKDFL